MLRTGLRRDTRSVEVVLSPDVQVDEWRAFVTRAEEAHFSGWRRRYEAFLLTVVASVELAPPRPIREPPGLAMGEPSHSWMAAPMVADDPSGRDVR